MKVKIRSWSDMEAHYGLDDDGDIPCDMTYSQGMEEWMPGDRIIELNEDDEPFYQWYVNGIDAYTVTDDMIEFILPEEEEGDLSYGIAKPLGQHTV